MPERHKTERAQLVKCAALRAVCVNILPKWPKVVEGIGVVFFQLHFFPSIFRSHQLASTKEYKRGLQVQTFVSTGGVCSTLASSRATFPESLTGPNPLFLPSVFNAIFELRHKYMCFFFFVFSRAHGAWVAETESLTKHKTRSKRHEHEACVPPLALLLTQE